jgi:peptidoglycan-associated lipoprotein
MVLIMKERSFIMKKKEISIWKITINYFGLLAVVTSLLISVSCTKQVVQSESSAVEEMQASEEQVVPDDTALATLDKTEQDLQKGEIAEQEEKEEGIEKTNMNDEQVFTNENICFNFDSDMLGDKAKEVLLRKAEWLSINPDASVIIEGHCDEQGTNAYNIALGARRAESAEIYLDDLGINAGQLTIVSYGEERPVDIGNGEKAWAKNRRVHFVLE